MRMIDADVLKEKLIKERDSIPLTKTERYSFGVDLPNPHGTSMRGGINKAFRCMEETPTIDAVPVVRCRDCVSGPKNPHVRIFHCNVLGCGGMKPSDFCSYGKRKAENPCDHCMSGSYRGCDGCSYGEKKDGK